ncbi:MAG: hypothetical protein DHS20C17_04630 [Cyclobacteriaceae bacterium]|nr:MAG: hypothetical protein DHS20C17_04630 [Cyclobacteriaceae bacterium]
MNTLKSKFLENGYVIVDILEKTELESFRQIMADLLDVEVRADNREVHSSSFQHLGDEIRDFARENRQYYFHLLTKPGTESIHHAFHNPRIMGVVESLLGPDLIINNASILAANKGVKYDLGWHRDVIQIPQQEIEEDYLYSKTRFHNSCQINLPLYDEDALWVVPGSHNRVNTSEENAVFDGSKHYAPLGKEMPGAIPVPLKAGQAVFYNNNLIHRGYTEEVIIPRRTIHMGYHSASKPPTWHFYLLNAALLKPDYLAGLSATMQNMMHEYLECRRQFPQMSDTWKRGFAERI